MRNILLLTPEQKKVIETPMMLHEWVQSHLVLKNKVKHDTMVELKTIIISHSQEKGELYLADSGEKHNLFKYSFVRHPYER